MTLNQNGGYFMPIIMWVRQQPLYECILLIVLILLMQSYSSHSLTQSGHVMESTTSSNH